VQLTQQLHETFYDDYLMTVTHSSTMQEFQRQQAEEFVDRFQLREKRVIELGCGDGNYMEYLRRAGALVFGLEPSVRFRALAERQGFTVFSGYVTAETPPPGGPYDAFVARQVLEHLASPNDFLQGVRRSLVPEAAGLVEVPCLEQALRQRRFYDFFPDHLNYFSKRTLRWLLERHAFEVISLSEGMRGEFNVATVRLESASEFTALERTVQNLTNELRSFLERYAAEGKRVAVWGAGGKGVSSLAVGRVSSVVYVVDSDPHKQGLLLPVSHLRVVEADRLQSDPVDAVLVTALAYRDEIVTLLRDKYRFRGQIAILGPQLEVLQGVS
jgi:SAM-dependent methyltransferase